MLLLVGVIWTTVFLKFAIRRFFLVLDSGYRIAGRGRGVGASLTGSLVRNCGVEEVRVDFLELVEHLVAVLGEAE